MSIIDFHSHILPGIDDGAKNTETSLAMLEMCSRQKVDIMAATPHFYASRDRIQDFLKRREKAYEMLQASMRENTDTAKNTYPYILKGAEVAFFDGISRAKEIDSLTIEGTNILLLEMPFVPWTEANLSEVRSLIYDRNLHVMIAHLERFLWMPGNRKMAQKIFEFPVTVQINAEAFDDRFHRGKLIRMFQQGTAHVLGSDCHGAHHRIPNLEAGRKILEKKAGSAVLEKIDAQGRQLLKMEE